MSINFLNVSILGNLYIVLTTLKLVLHFVNLDDQWLFFSVQPVGWTKNKWANSPIHAFDTNGGGGAYHPVVLLYCARGLKPSLPSKYNEQSWRGLSRSCSWHHHIRWSHEAVGLNPGMDTHCIYMLLFNCLLSE